MFPSQCSLVSYQGFGYLGAGLGGMNNDPAFHLRYGFGLVPFANPVLVAHHTLGYCLPDNRSGDVSQVIFFLVVSHGVAVFLQVGVVHLPEIFTAKTAFDLDWHGLSLHLLRGKSKHAVKPKGRWKGDTGKIFKRNRTNPFYSRLSY